MIESQKLNKLEISILQNDYDSNKNIVRGLGALPFVIFFVVCSIIISNPEKEFDEKFMLIFFVFLILGIWLYLGLSAVFKIHDLKTDIKNCIKHCGEVVINGKKIDYSDDSSNSYYLLVSMYTGFLKVNVTEANFHLVDLHSQIYLEILPKSKKVLKVIYKGKPLYLSDLAGLL